MVCPENNFWIELAAGADKRIPWFGATQGGIDVVAKITKFAGNAIRVIEKNDTAISNTGYPILIACTAIDYTLALNHSREMKMAHANMNATANAIAFAVGRVSPLVGAAMGLTYAAVDLLAQLEPQFSLGLLRRVK